MGPILQALKQGSPESVEKVAKDFLPTLFNLDQDVYQKVTEPVIISMLRYLEAEGGKYKNESLTNSVKHVCRALWGKPEIPTRQKVEEKPTTKDPEREKFEQERNAFRQEQHRRFESGVATNAVKIVNDKLMMSLANIPSLSDFSKKAIVKEIRETMGRQLQNDREHIKTMERLWDGATKAGYAGDWSQRLVTAYLTRAKQILPAIRQTVLSEALGKKTVTKTQAGKPSKPVVKRPAPGGDKGERQAVVIGAKRGSIDPKKIDWDKTSDTDYLNRKVVLKKK